NPTESTTFESNVETPAGMNFNAETLRKTDQKIGNDARASVTRPTGVMSNNEDTSTRANFESETGKVGVPDNEPPANVQDNVVSNTPEVDAKGAKEKTQGNVMHGDASD
ncbi:hypothetical protein A2U01_0066554, partial [Trifolium medium]|nr:hypothetical protein [Trifolium medium]